MPTTQIVCPRCHSKFTLKAPSLDAMANKVFKCPKCGTATSFSSMMPRRQPSAAPQAMPKTNIGGVPPTLPNTPGTPGVGGTRLDAGTNPSVTLIVEGGKAFKLRNGTYTIGRDSRDSMASLKLAPDQYMSRLQAQLEIVAGQTGTGKPVVCRISNLSSTNALYVNNTRIEFGKSSFLNPGDKLLLGMTKATIQF